MILNDLLFVFLGIIGETSMQMDISLSNVNVGMPLSVQDKYLVEGRSLYLIRPFDVKVASLVLCAALSRMLCNRLTLLVLTMLPFSVDRLLCCQFF